VSDGSIRSAIGLLIIGVTISLATIAYAAGLFRRGRGT